MWHQLLARLVRTSRVIDRGYLAFNRLRSRAVLALGGDRFFDAYNAIAYRDEPLHREGSGPRTLRAWECDFIRNLPPPPARILLGGAGTGREALAFAALGYQVVAFDSARPLVEEMQALAADQPAVEALLGGYQSLPVLHRLNGEEVDLAARLEFDATYVGWASLSTFVRMPNVCPSSHASPRSRPGRFCFPICPVLTPLVLGPDSPFRSGSTDNCRASTFDGLQPRLDSMS